MDLLVVLAFVLNLTLGRIHAVEPNLECPHGWIDGGEMGCFLFQAENVNISWIDALQECEKLGGFLMEPKTDDQFQFVSSLALAVESFTGVASWWVGLSDLGHEGTWTWQLSMEQAEDVMWANHHPDQKPDNVNDCVTLTFTHGDFAFEDNTCKESNLHGNMVAPVCQRGGLLTTTSLSPSPTLTSTALPDCPFGWKQFKQSCFQHFNTEKNFWDAETYCIDQGGHLSSIHSQEENDFLQAMFSNEISQVNSFHWTGGYMVYDGNNVNHPNWENFTWTDGSSVDYLNWLSNEPGRQYYLAIDSDQNWQWRDLDRSINQFFCRITY